MGIKNPEVLYTDGCRVIIGDELCGKPADNLIHISGSIVYDHEYQE